MRPPAARRPPSCRPRGRYPGPERCVRSGTAHARRAPDKPVSKDEILKKCGKSQSSIYRKFNELLRVGFIVPVGYTKAFNRVRVYDKIISKAEFSVSTKISQIRLQINLLRLPEPQMEEPVYS